MQENLKAKYNLTDKELRRLIDNILQNLKKEDLRLPIVAITDLLLNGDIPAQK